MNDIDPSTRPMASPLQDIRKVRQGGAATAKELKDFLAQLQGKNPREVLGAVATSGLFRGVVAASVWTLVILAATTAGPYVWGQAFGGKDAENQEQAASGEAEGAKSATEAEAAKSPADAAAVATPAPPSPAAGTPAQVGAPVSPPTGEAAAKTVDALGIGETKSAPANVNPLEKAADDLLKGLD